MIPEPDKPFVLSVLASLLKVPFDECIILHADKSAYADTVKALRTIIEERLDKSCGFEITIASHEMFMRRDDDTSESFHKRFDENVTKTFIPGIDYNPLHFRKLYPTFAPSRNIKQSPNVTKENISPMTTKAKETKTETALAIPSNEIIAANYSAAKEKMEALVGEVTAIISIETDEAAAALRSKTDSLNEALKMIETVRKKIKEPFLETGKTIDRIAKEIAASGDVQVNRSKKLLLDYDNAKRLVYEKQQKEAEEQRREADRIAQEALGDIDARRNELKSLENEIFALFMDDRVKPAAVYKSHIANFQPTAEVYGDLLAHAQQMRVRVIELGKAREAYLNAKAKRGAGTITAQQMEDNENLWVFAKSKYNLAKSRAFNETEAVIEEKKEEVVLQAEIEKSTVTGQVMTAAPESNISVRKTLKWRVLNNDAVPDAFKCVDEAKLKEWMKPQTFEEGERVSGFTYTDMGNGTYKRTEVDALEFYYEETPVLR